jgi:hypothetical protein
MLVPVNLKINPNLKKGKKGKTTPFSASANFGVSTAGAGISLCRFEVGCCSQPYRGSGQVKHVYSKQFLDGSNFRATASSENHGAAPKVLCT